MRWCTGLTPALECLDDDHVSPAAWARWTVIERLFRHVVIGWWRDGEQFACAREVGLACRRGEQAVVTDAVSAWNVEESLVRRELLPVCPAEGTV